MYTLILSLNPHRKLPVTVFADGNALKFKKKKNGYECEYVTPNKDVNIDVRTVSEVNSKWWWLTSLLFFFFSCFGIFDAHYDKKCTRVKYSATVTLSENEINVLTVKYNPVSAGFKCVECKGNCTVQETENIYYIDDNAKKRLKKLRLIKALSWVGLVLAAIIACLIAVFA